MNLLIDYCNMEELDISRAVDDLIYGRLNYLQTAKGKAEQKAKKEMDPKEFVDNYWNNYKEESTEKDRKKKNEI